MGIYSIFINYPSSKAMKFELYVGSSGIRLDASYDSNYRIGMNWFDFIAKMICTTDQIYVSSVNECQFCAIG